MNLKSAAAAFTVGTLSLFGAGTSYGTGHENHVARALEHAQAAFVEGRFLKTAKRRALSVRQTPPLHRALRTSCDSALDDEGVKKTRTFSNLSNPQTRG